MRVLFLNINEHQIKAFSTYDKAKESFIEDFQRISGTKDKTKVSEVIFHQKFESEDGIHFLKGVMVNDDVPNKVYIRCENKDIDNIKVFWEKEDIPKAFNDVTNNRVELVHVG